jgi:hypothetical protein
VLAIGSWWLASWASCDTLLAVLLGLAVADGACVHCFVERDACGDTCQLARTRVWLVRLDLLVAFIVTLAASRVVGGIRRPGRSCWPSVGMAVAAGDRARHHGGSVPGSFRRG